MHSSPSSKVTVGLCELGPKNPEKTRHICESNSWKLNTSKSGFTSIESFSFLKGWSPPWAESQHKVFLDCRCLQGESCSRLVCGLTWVQVAVPLKSHCQGSSHPFKRGRRESCEVSHRGPLGNSRTGGWVLSPSLAGWLSLPVPSLPLPVDLGTRRTCRVQTTFG